MAQKSWAEITMPKLYECNDSKKCDHKVKQITGRGGLVVFLCKWFGYCPHQARKKPKRRDKI